MGFDINGVKFLLCAQTAGVSFAKVATIGRQGLHLNTEKLKKVLRSFKINKTDAEISWLLSQENGYSEPFLRSLGAAEICSIDLSAYEGASFLHDMNQPIPDELKNRFTAVIDGGSLEHIFDFPKAIRSCMEMVAVGGHFLGITPANNFMGHGFYQFSPELYFRIFTKNNGFNIEKAIVFEMSSSEPKWYTVADPEKVRRRVELVNQYPVYLLIQAKKVDCVPVFMSSPQQSDYIVRWVESNAQGGLFEASFPNSSDSAAHTTAMKRCYGELRKW
jgi:hypothetical protein